MSTLAYGITGSGKTYTMLGKGFESIHQENCETSQQQKGILLYALEELFELLENKIAQSQDEKQQSSIEISYLEVYNEKIRDLLNTELNNLVILEDPVNGIVVPGLKRWAVKSLEQAAYLIQQGNLRRTMAATHSNKFSSRSHAILSVYLDLKMKWSANQSANCSRSENSLVDYDKNQYTVNIKSKLNLVDLAGSEKEARYDDFMYGGYQSSSYNKYSNASYEYDDFQLRQNKNRDVVDYKNSKQSCQRHEGSNINKSLLALANCIKLLSEKHTSSAHIPYRDSKLTRILKDSLGGAGLGDASYNRSKNNSKMASYKSKLRVK